MMQLCPGRVDVANRASLLIYYYCSCGRNRLVKDPITSPKISFSGSFECTSGGQSTEGGELRARESKKRRRALNQGMDIIKRSEEFYQLLGSSLKQGCCTDNVFMEEYEVTFLGTGTITPFTDFVGQQERPTVVVSKHAPKTQIEEHSENLEALELLADLNPEVEDPLPISSWELEVVDIGQPLPSKRVYLTHSSPLHRGWSDARTKTVTFTEGNDGLLPLPLDSARFIVSLYSLGSWRTSVSPPDVWVLCDRNQRKIVALGCSCDKPKSPVVIYTVEEEDIASEPDIKSKVRKTTASSRTAFSKYDINGSDGENEFSIHFSWNDPDGMLSPPLQSSNAILNLSTTPGDLFSPVLSMYQELRSLCKIANNEAEWPVTSESGEEVLTSTNKTVDVESFIQDMVHPLTQQADVTVLSPTTDFSIYEPRTDLDFGERLWLFCHSLTSFDDVQLVCAEAFKAVLMGKVQPIVHRKSTSTLSLLLRQVLHCPDAASLQDISLKFQLLLTEARLLPCLVQLGIEKMKRDYKSFFVGTNICSAEQFEKFFAPGASPLVQCLELCRIHSILELNATIMKMLRLPTTSILSTFTKAAVEVFAKHPNYLPFACTPVFSLPLPAFSPDLKSVLALCSNLSPVVWTVTEQDSQNKCIVYLFRTRPLFGYLLDTETPSKHEMYYSYKCYYEATIN